MPASRGCSGLIPCGPDPSAAIAESPPNAIPLVRPPLHVRNREHACILLATLPLTACGGDAGSSLDPNLESDNILLQILL